MPPAPPKYGAATSTIGRDGANVRPPSLETASVMLRPSFQTTYCVPSAPTVPIGPTTAPLSSRGSPARVLMRIGFDQLRPPSVERENRITDWVSCHSIHARYRLPRCGLRGAVSDHMRGMSSSCRSGSSPRQTLIGVGAGSQVRPPSGERSTQMPLPPAPCAQYPGRPFFWIDRYDRNTLPLSSNASETSPSVMALSAMAWTAVKVRPPSIEK